MVKYTITITTLSLHYRNLRRYISYFRLKCERLARVIAQALPVFDIKFDLHLHFTSKDKVMSIREL